MSLIDRDNDLNGELGNDTHFSELYVDCLRAEFTGGVVLWDEREGFEGKIFFIKGEPFHLSGEMFAKHDLGSVLIKLRLVTPADVELAVEVQSQQPPDERQMLGELLKKECFLDEGAVEGALTIQNKHRLSTAFAIEDGLWRGIWSDRLDIVTKGSPIDGWSVLAAGLKRHASDQELRTFSKSLQGRAVKLTCSPAEAEEYGVDEEDEPLLELIEVPRSVELFEKKAPSRRKARALLKAMHLAGVLETLPASAAVSLDPPAPKPDPTKPAGMPEPSAGSKPTGMPEPSASSKPMRRVASPEKLKVSGDIQRTHRKLGKANHFELLGVPEDSSSDTIREQYMAVVRRFHPDTLTPLGLDDELLEKARLISAKLNEAYDTLRDPEAGAAYRRSLTGQLTKEQAVIEANKKLRMAQVLIKKRDFAGARDLLTSALEHSPEDGLCKAYLAWGLWLDPDLLQDAVTPRVMELLQSAVKIVPDEAEPHFFLGSVLKVTGKIEKAAREFKKTVNIDPDHVGATREIRLLRMRAKGR